MQVDDSLGKYLDFNKYLYDKVGNLTEWKDSTHDAGIMEDIEFHYVNNLPVYATSPGSKKHLYNYVIKNNKIISKTSASGSTVYAYIYEDNNTTISSKVSKEGKLCDTNTYGVKKNPHCGCHFKWLNLISVFSADNEVIQHKSFGSFLSTYVNERYTYTYNDQGYPIKRINSFRLDDNSKTPVVMKGNGSIIYYEYIPAK